MEAKTEKKGNIIDAFVGGARNGFKIGTNYLHRSWESLDSRVLLQQHGWQFLYLWEEPQVLSPDFLRLDR